MSERERAREARRGQLDDEARTAEGDAALLLLLLLSLAARRGALCQRAGTTFCARVWWSGVEARRPTALSNNRSANDSLLLLLLEKRDVIAK